jgi:hypothetical protein
MKIKTLNKTTALRRQLRINAKAPEHGLVFAPGIAIELNADNTLPEWIKLAPFGEHPTRDKKAVQVFNAESADQIISWFNFFPRKLARLANINSVKVWVGHPDFAPNEWPERIDLGSVTELKHDDTDLWGKVRWNAGAVEHVTKHKFPSVAWDCEVNGDGTETPAFLWSVGMWHKPNIKSVEAVINAAEDYQEPETTNPEQGTPTMLNKIMEALKAAGIVKDDDAEETILGAIGSLIQSIAYRREETARQKAAADTMRVALNAVADVAELPDDGLPDAVVAQLNAVISERDAQAATIAELNSRISTLSAERVVSAVAHAIATGRATKADEDRLTAELNADFDGTLCKLSAQRVQLNSQSLNLGRNKAAITTEQDRAAQLNGWVEDCQIRLNCDYATAWNASKTDEKMAVIHAAMEAADKARGTAAE